MAKTNEMWITVFPTKAQQWPCQEWAKTIVRAFTVDPRMITVSADLSVHLSGCHACREVVESYPLIEALVGELFVYLSDEARAALLGVRPTVAPDEIPAAPEVPITPAFAQLWHAWQAAEGGKRLAPVATARIFRPAVWAHTMLLVPSRLVLCKLARFLVGCGQIGQLILWAAGHYCRQMIVSWSRSMRDLGWVLI